MTGAPGADGDPTEASLRVVAPEPLGSPRDIPGATANRAASGKKVERAGTPPWLLVMRREIIVRLADKAFLAGTAVTLVMIVGFCAYGIWDTERVQTATLVTASADAGLAERVVQEAPEVDDRLRVEVREAGSPAAAEALVRDGEADAWLRPGDDGWVLTTESEPVPALEQVVAAVVRTDALEEQATRLGTTPEALEAGSRVTPEFLEGDADRAGLASAVAFAFAFLFYITSVLFGYQLANSVVEEKQNRVVEIIATSIPLRHLLAGKVLGNSVIAVLQMMLYAAVALVGLSFTPYDRYVAGISGPVSWFLVFFVAGFAAMAALWAVAGSLASRTEDVQSTSTPMTMLVVAVFFGALFAPDRWASALSFVPPFSAVLMPTRLVEGEAAVWEPLLALALILVAAAAIIVVAERIYRRSLLQTGGKLSMRQAWSAPE
ncbi:MAG: ABC transporter permease [Dermatophilaceae bacterium]